MTDVKKIVELNGTYVCKFDPIAVGGYASTFFIKGSITVSKDNSKYVVETHNVNERNVSTSSYIAENKYVINNDGTVDIIFDDGYICHRKLKDIDDVYWFIACPQCWSGKMMSKLHEVIADLADIQM